MRRGANIDPPNRFDARHVEPDLADLAWDQEYLAGLDDPQVTYLPDDSQSIVTENNSPDVPFRFGVNPYRGCLHGCSYCYARPYHEYLGLSGGVDFETKIFVKHRAAALFRAFLEKDSWRPEPIVFSGITDCYQPAERRFRLTRGCLAVARDFGQPISIITKNALVVRDLDILRPMAAENLVHVAISLTTLQPELARAMEPKTSTPTARLRAIEMLAAAGVPVRVMVAPIVPGLNDNEIPALLASAQQAGARAASYTLVRLPLSVEPVFREWLARTQPDRREKVESFIRQTRGGKFNSTQFGQRMRGAGVLAQQIGDLFKVFAHKHGLDGPLPEQDTSRFRPPRAKNGQLRLF